MTVTGKAIKTERKEVISSCGFKGKCGFTATGTLYGADAKISFIPLTSKVHKLTITSLDGKPVKITKKLHSKYNPGMWTFYINFVGES